MDLETNHFIIEAWSKARLLPWHWIAPSAHIMMAIIAVAHAMLFKRDPRAALGWVSISLFIPFLGPLLYYMFGINRIHTQARKLAHLRSFRIQVGYERGSLIVKDTDTIAQELGPSLDKFIRISDHVTSRPLLSGNKVEILENGEQAYPAMLAAINDAVNNVMLVTYLFESDHIGESYVNALTEAHQRGVKVQVILDGVGALYSWPSMGRKLRDKGIPVAYFLSPKLLPPTFSVNLRNHRKILVVDGIQGFTGGMNIGARHLVDAHKGLGTTDLHFHLQGPVVTQLEDIFAEDWQFTTGKALEKLTPNQEVRGDSYCRCISDGPNDDLDKISLIMMGSISAAQHNITIITPYFLPSREMIASLQSAALRGIDVDIILPKKSNLRFIDWATRNMLWELLQHNIKVYYQPPPFPHTKLFVVDEVYAHIGSANMDPRSFRLNFELNVEVLGGECIVQLVNYAQEIRRNSNEITLQDVDERSLPTRLRDSTCWLFMPYL
jgi:cardiolipin synthase